MYYSLFDLTRQKTKYYDAINGNNRGGGNTAVLNEQSVLTSTAADSLGITPSQREHAIFVSVDEAIDSIGISWNPVTGVQGRLFAATALLFTVDSMELAVLGYLSKAVDQRIELYKDDYVAWAGVAGSLVGALVLGTLADSGRGRQRVTLLLSQIITIFAILTAILCTFPLANPISNSSDMNSDNEKTYFVVQGVLLSRFLVGFGLGGITVPYDLLAEWLPNNTQQQQQQHNHISRHKGTNVYSCWSRGQVLLLLHIFWSVGALVIYILLETDTFLSPKRGQLTGMELWCCTLPAILATLLLVKSQTATYTNPNDGDSNVNDSETTTTFRILESPRFLLAQGRHDEALQVLRCAAIANGNNSKMLFPHRDNQNQSTRIVLYSNEMPRQIEPNTAPEEGTSLINGIQQQIISISSLFSIQWLTFASALLFTYFGQDFCYRGTGTMLVAVFDEDEHPQTYRALLTAITEFAGIALLFFVIDRWGRIPIQVAAFTLAAFSSLTLSMWYYAPFLENGNVLIALTFISRVLLCGGGAALWISTAEVLRTEIRTTGHAIAAGMSGRLGSFVATLTLPWVHSVPLLGIVVFFGSLAVAFAAGDIPETRGKDMGRSYNLLGRYSERRWSIRQI